MSKDILPRLGGTARQAARRSRPRPQQWAKMVGVLVGCVLAACVVATALLAPGGPRFLFGSRAPIAGSGLDAHAVGARGRGQPPVFTAPVAQSAAFARQHIAVDPLFQTYYASTAGTARMGAAITPAMPVAGGWLQFFSGGALFLDGRSPIVSSHWMAEASDGEMPAPTGALGPAIAHAIHVDAGAVTALPLLAILTRAGSEVPLDGASDFSYADLRAAIQTSRLVPAPAWYAPNRPAGPGEAFVPEATQHGVVLGHLVPLSFWTMMTLPTNAPDGWFAEYGEPRTEALPLTQEIGGVAHHLLVQVFQHAALVVDTSSPGQAPAPLAIGADYLRTFGPPTVLVATGTPAWVTLDTPARQQPGLTGPELAELGPGYPLRLASSARWVHGTLWYAASWTTPHGQGSGWLPASAVTFSSTNVGPASAGVDVLDGGLASYLAGLGDRAGMVVYDLTHHVYYASNPEGVFITASSVKVPIMLALLAQTEAQGREPDGNEMYLLTTMIENSDNGSAQALYEEIGDAPGLAAAMRQFGISGLYPTPDAWGWSHITPAAMAQLLTLLWGGDILTGADRALALELMESVESDQQFGVGDTAPAGGTTALKNGWVTGPDNLWDVNTSGIVTTPRETYIITVYTSGNASYQQGVDIVEQICAVVSADLG